MTRATSIGLLASVALLGLACGDRAVACIGQPADGGACESWYVFACAGEPTPSCGSSDTGGRPASASEIALCTDAPGRWGGRCQ
jgi:hypothetical protein